MQGLDTLVRSVLALLPKSHEEALIELPTPNSRKTRAIALWVLGVQRLPTAVTDKDEVTSGLCGCIKAALAEGEREEETVVADALKVSSEILVYLLFAEYLYHFRRLINV